MLDFDLDFLNKDRKTDSESQVKSENPITQLTNEVSSLPSMPATLAEAIIPGVFYPSTESEYESKGLLPILHVTDATDLQLRNSPITERDLFVNVRMDERFLIKDIEDIKILEDRIEQYQKIVIEAKGRATEVANKIREIEGKSGKNRWDKASGPKVKAHLANPDGLGALTEETKRHQKQLTKCEKAIAGFVSLGETDEDIIVMFNSKFKLAEIKAAILKAREE